MEQNISWVWGMVLFPFFIAIFKTELGSIWKAWRISALKEFDVGKPVQILNGATGQWGDIEIIKYQFHISAKKRGVRIRYPDGAIETISLLSWATMRKRQPAKEYK